MLLSVKPVARGGTWNDLRRERTPIVGRAVGPKATVIKLEVDAVTNDGDTKGPVIPEGTPAAVIAPERTAQVEAILELLGQGRTYDEVIHLVPGTTRELIQDACARASQVIRAGKMETAGDLLGAAVGHYVHQNELMWSRTQLAMATEAACLAATYATFDLWPLPHVLLGIGTVILILIWTLMYDDRRSRDVNRDLREELATLLSAGLANRFVIADHRKRNARADWLFLLAVLLNLASFAYLLLS